MFITGTGGVNLAHFPVKYFFGTPDVMDTGQLVGIIIFVLGNIQ